MNSRVHLPSVDALPAKAAPRAALRFVDTNASVLLDLLRGLAAVFVLIEHWRNILFVNFRDVATHRMFWAPAYIACSCGIAAVMLFFVLSGYLVGGSALRMFQQNAWSWREYLLHRGTRLWIVLLPALLLCALFDAIGLRMPFATAMYHGLADDHVILNVAARHTVPVFFGNLFFLQTIRLPFASAEIPTFGSAGSLWSLANEFWYYLLFPMIVLVFRRGTQTLHRALYVLGIAGILWFIGPGIRNVFPVWLLGALLTQLRPAHMSAGVRWAVGMLYLIPFATSRWWTIGVNLSNFTLGLITSFLLWTMLSATTAASGHPWQKVARWLASFSFTLYLIHIPLCAVLSAWFVRTDRFQPELRAMPVALGILAVIVGASYLLATVTEYRTNQTRLWILRRFFQEA